MESSGHDDWAPPILETVATAGEGIEDVIETLEAHREYLDRSGERESRERTRQAATIRRILRAEVRDAISNELDDRDGLDDLVDREIDPYTAADEVFGPIADCLDASADEDE